MDIDIEVELVISGYADGTGTGLAQDLMAWLNEYQGLSGTCEVASQDDHSYFGSVLLLVRLSAGSDVNEFPDALSSWLHARHLRSSVTIRGHANGRRTAELYWYDANPEALERLLADLAQMPLTPASGASGFRALG